MTGLDSVSVFKLVFPICIPREAKYLQNDEKCSTQFTLLCFNKRVLIFALLSSDILGYLTQLGNNVSHFNLGKPITKYK